MLIAEANLYLPISEQILCQIIEGGTDNLEKAFSSLNIPQIASLLLLQNLSKINNEHPERILAKNIDILNSCLKERGLASVRNEVVPVFNVNNIKEGYMLLPSLGITILNEETIKEREYLNFEAKWDYTFNERHRTKLKKSLITVNNSVGRIQTLTLEQSRIYREIAGQIDDPTHVQGYGGSGKSSLIRNLIPLFARQGGQVLLLAESPMQIKALMSGISQMEHVFPNTFARLAYEIIPQDLTNRNKRIWKERSSKATMPDNEIIRYFGIVSSGKLSSDFIVKAIRGTLQKFCYSGEGGFQLNHIPNKYISSLDITTIQIVLYYAEKLWKEILNPMSKDFNPPIRGYHLIKWAALNGWQIPNKYTHILIDECHNLAKSILQILDCSPQAVISLGDEYQNLQGKSQRRAHVIRYREVTQSVRSGRLIENIVNPIIARHPSKVKIPFQGNPLNTLEITYYNKPQIPDKPAAILANSMWGLFEWAQRLACQNLNIHPLTDIDKLVMFVGDCIELFHRRTQPRHGELFRFKDWDEVTRHYNNNEGFRKIDRLLRKGYGYKDWAETSAKFTKDKPHPYLLGMVKDVQNREFSRVMVIPEVVSPVWQTTPENVGAVNSAIYVAVTRAKEYLIVPEELRNWLEKISAS